MLQAYLLKDHHQAALPQKSASSVNPVAMPDTAQLVFSTSALAFVTGFFLGIYAIRGYLIPESWTAERQGNKYDPLESDESDIDEDDTILDHAPNWANGKEADRRDGLRQEKLRRKETDTSDAPVADNGNEECKLVLVVRTDLGMTKGKFLQPHTGEFAVPLESLLLIVEPPLLRQDCGPVFTRDPRLLQGSVPRRLEERLQLC